MPLIAGTAFLVAALLTCVLPISLLICFAVFFVRQARRIPDTQPPSAGAPRESAGASVSASQQGA
jgi:hypothetical protein